MYVVQVNWNKNLQELNHYEHAGTGYIGIYDRYMTKTLHCEYLRTSSYGPHMLQ